jgi:hypothetical protein
MTSKNHDFALPTRAIGRLAQLCDIRRGDVIVLTRSHISLVLMVERVTESFVDCDCRFGHRIFYDADLADYGARFVLLSESSYELQSIADAIGLESAEDLLPLWAIQEYQRLCETP